MNPNNFLNETQPTILKEISEILPGTRVSVLVSDLTRYSYQTGAGEQRVAPVRIESSGTCQRVLELCILLVALDPIPQSPPY